jgi:glutamate-ammonia-ligase adenylyltransferase
LRGAFETIRKQVLCAPRELPTLAAEIVAMRHKLRAAYPVPAGQFDCKHSPGGMIDAEFAVQYLVLAYAADHPGLQGNIGNIALLQHAQSVGLLPDNVGLAAASAYRSLRHWQHQARLDEQAQRAPLPDCLRERAAVLALWHTVFPQD